jgi:DNA-binding MarR family transcriptional regulator
MSVYAEAVNRLREIEQAIQDELEGTMAEDLSPMQACVLAELRKRNGQKASALAASIGRPATSFTPILDSLERQNLLARRPDPDDRRAIQVWLTDIGARACGAIVPALERVEKRFATEPAWVVG